MILVHYISIFRRGYFWSRDKPQSIGYGVLIYILGMTGLPDFLVQILGIVVLIGGALAAWDQLKQKSTPGG